MKYELGGKYWQNLPHWDETQSYLTDDSDENKITKDTKKCVIKRNVKFEDYKNCLEATQLENKKYQLKKNKLDVESLREVHKVFMKNIN